MNNLKINGDINPIVWWAFKSSESDYSKPGTINIVRMVVTYELEFIISSEGGYEILDGKKYYHHSGDIIFRRPGMMTQSYVAHKFYRIIFSLVYSNSGYISDPINYSKESEIYFNEVYTNNQQDEITKGQAVFPIDIPAYNKTSQTSEFRTLFENISAERSYDRDQTHFFTKSYLIQILVLLYNEISTKNDNMQSAYSIRVNYKKILKVKKYIDDNIRLKFKIDQLASIAGLSPGYFTKTFKLIIMQSPIEYINKSKINQIKNMLIYSDKEIKEIYSEYGFEDHSYFFRIFKKFLGITPTAYRKMYKNSSFIEM